MTVSPTCRAALAALVLFAAGCSQRSSSSSSSTSTPAAAPGAAPAPSAPSFPPPPSAANDDQPLPVVPSPYDALPAESRGLLDQPFTGDFDEMVKRRIIRAGVVFNRT